jgi:hypothetical protein
LFADVFKCTIPLGLAAKKDFQARCGKVPTPNTFENVRDLSLISEHLNRNRRLDVVVGPQDELPLLKIRGVQVTTVDRLRPSKTKVDIGSVHPLWT